MPSHLFLIMLEESFCVAAAALVVRDRPKANGFYHGGPNPKPACQKTCSSRNGLPLMPFLLPSVSGSEQRESCGDGHG